MTTFFYNSKMIDSDMIFVFLEPSLLKVSNSSSWAVIVEKHSVIVNTIISKLSKGDCEFACPGLNPLASKWELLFQVF